MHSYRVVLFAALSLIIGTTCLFLRAPVSAQQPQQRLVDEAKHWIVNKTCADRSYGARPLRRALQKYVEDPLSEALIQGQLADASLVEMFVDGSELNFRSISIDDEGHERVNDLLLTQ